jgi:hypothetical protein
VCRQDTRPRHPRHIRRRPDWVESHVTYRLIRDVPKRKILTHASSVVHPCNVNPHELPELPGSLFCFHHSSNPSDTLESSDSELESSASSLRSKCSPTPMQVSRHVLSLSLSIYILLYVSSKALTVSRRPDAITPRNLSLRADPKPATYPEQERLSLTNGNTSTST